MPFDHRARSAVIVACLTMAVCGAGFRVAVGYLNVYLKKEPIPVRDDLRTIDKVLPTWRAEGIDAILPAPIVEELGTSQYLDRLYMRGSDMRLAVHVDYYTGMIDAVPHIPDRCFVAAGWNPVTSPENLPLPITYAAAEVDEAHVNRATGRPYVRLRYRSEVTARQHVVRLPVDELSIRVTEFQHAEQPEARMMVGYLFIANGRATPMPERIRMLAFDKTDRYAYYCKVQFSMAATPRTGRDDFISGVTGLLSEFLPELMRCLPDWAEVEWRAAEGLTS
jgi:hypothetical protein